MWLGTFMKRSEIKEYDTLLTGDIKIPENDAYKVKESEVSELKFLNKTAYNELILA